MIGTLSVRWSLVIDHLILLLLLGTELEVFRSFDGELLLELALRALHTQDDLLRRFRFLVKHGLLLATVALLFHVVAAFALRVNAVFALLVLRHLVQRVLLAVLALAECAARFRYVDHRGERGEMKSRREKNCARRNLIHSNPSSEEIEMMGIV